MANILQTARRAIGRAALRLTAKMAAYDVTGGGRRIQGWNPTDDSVNRVIQANGDSLRRYARDAERRNCYAKNAVRAYVSNVVGTGIQPQSQHPDPKKREAINAAFLRWTDECDADGTTDFYGLQRMAAQTSYVAGESLVRFRPRYLRDGLTVPLQLQVLEPEFLPLNEQKELVDGKVRWGIEYNRIGRRRAYWLYKEHPNEEWLWNSQGEMARVPAEYVCHLYHATRPGQQRGETQLASALVPLYEIEQYESAELIRKGLTAMYAFFTRDLEGGAFSSSEETDAAGNQIQAVEPGSVVNLPSGRTVEAPNFPDVGGQYQVFLKQQLHKVAAGLNVPYHLLTGDLADFNYSSIRAAILEFRRMLEQFQHQVIVFQLCRPTWRAFMDAAAYARVIDPVDYALNRAEYLAVEWVPDAWEWVDPETDVKTEVLLIDNLLKPRSRVIRQMGDDPVQVDKDIAADQASEDSQKLRRGQKALPQAIAAESPQNGVKR